MLRKGRSDFPEILARRMPRAFGKREDVLRELRHFRVEQPAASSYVAA